MLDGVRGVWVAEEPVISRDDGEAQREEERGHGDWRVEAFI